MEGAFLTITLSIFIPLLILLVVVLVIFIVLKKCAVGKMGPSENGNAAPCLLQECTVETNGTPTCPDEPILNMQDVDANTRSSFSAEEPILRLPLYSTLPRNSTRPFSRDCSHGAESRQGYRLYPANYSPFSQDTSFNRSNTMHALSMYCDRYIADAAHYDPPPPYDAGSNTTENSQLIRTISGGEVTSLCSSTYGCETWI